MMRYLAIAVIVSLSFVVNAQEAIQYDTVQTSETAKAELTRDLHILDQLRRAGALLQLARIDVLNEQISGQIQAVTDKMLSICAVYVDRKRIVDVTAEGDIVVKKE